MPAPVPIRIRYGPAGLLAEAAASSALMGSQAESRERQRARDHEFILTELARRQRNNEIAQANELAGRELQMAHSLALEKARGATPTSDLYFRGRGPLTDSIRAQKNLVRTTTLAGVDLTPEQEAAFDMLEQQEGVTTDQFQKIARDAAQRDQVRKRESAAARQAVERRESEARKLNLQQADREVADLNRQIAQLLKDDPDLATAAPADLFPQQGMSILGKAADFYTGGAISTATQTGGNPERLARFQQLAQLQRKVQQAQEKRQRLISAVGVGTDAESQPVPQQPPQQYNVGQLLNTPAGRAKVVGFDEDGMPLIEPL